MTSKKYMGLVALHCPGSGENPHGSFKRAAEKIMYASMHFNFYA